MNRRIIALAAAAVLAAACGIDHGYVTAKRDVPAHDESYTEQIKIGESCTTTSSGSGKNKTTTRNCTPNYMYVPATRHVARSCYVSLQNEKESGERGVDCAAWDGLKVNDQVTFK